MIAVRDIAWAAGFLEGEGHFYKEEAGIHAAQIEREPLERLQRLFKGTIRVISPKGNHQSHHSWSIHGTNAAGAMMTLWSFMCSKRRSQIERSLGVWKAQTRKRSYEYREKRTGSLKRRMIGPRVSHDSQYCASGHDLSVVGRSTHGCRKCARDYGRNYMRSWRAKRRLAHG